MAPYAVQAVAVASVVACVRARQISISFLLSPPSARDDEGEAWWAWHRAERREWRRCERDGVLPRFPPRPAELVPGSCMFAMPQAHPRLDAAATLGFQSPNPPMPFAAQEPCSRAAVVATTSPLLKEEAHPCQAHPSRDCTSSPRLVEPSTDRRQAQSSPRLPSGLTQAVRVLPMLHSVSLASEQAGTPTPPSPAFANFEHCAWVVRHLARRCFVTRNLCGQTGVGLGEVHSFS